MMISLTKVLRLSPEQSFRKPKSTLESLSLGHQQLHEQHAEKSNDLKSVKLIRIVILRLYF